MNNALENIFWNYGKKISKFIRVKLLEVVILVEWLKIWINERCTKKLQKETGIKMGKYDNQKNKLYNEGKMLLRMLELYIKEVEDANMENEQFFLDFEDSINAMSIIDHYNIKLGKGLAGLIE